MTILVAVLIAAVAQPPSSFAESEANSKQFLELETKLMGAAQLKNAQTLEALVAPTFGFSLMIEGREPEVLSRSEWLRLTNVYSRLEGFELRSVATGVFGDHAVVRAQVLRKGTVGSKDLSGEYVLVDLWDKQDGTWKIRYRVVARPVPPLSR